MSKVCKNCDQTFEGNFCNKCGQTADTYEIDFRFLKKRIYRLLFKFSDKGILYTCRQLYTRPGFAIREYIEGKRIRYFDPLSLLITLAASYGFLFHYFSINFFSDISLSEPEFRKIDFISVNEWISTHFALTSGLLIPVYSIGSFIAFRKQGYNFVEHLTLNTFLSSQRLIFRIVLFPLMILYNGTPQIHTLGNVFILLDLLLLIWSYSQFFNNISKAKSYVLSLLSYLIFIICLLLLVAIGIFIGGYLTDILI